MAAGYLFFRWLGRYSTGIRLAVEYGAASAMLYEYAYRNIPDGTGQLGRWIDRVFLDQEAWRALRLQVSSIKEAVRELVAQRRKEGLPTVVLDVASGPAPYLRELAREMGPDAPVVFCYDRNPHHVNLGRRLARTEKLPNVHFAVADPLDAASYLIPMHPDLVLAIGLFARLECDSDVQTVIRLAFQSLAPGGYFLSTVLGGRSSRLSDWGVRTRSGQSVARPAETIASWLRDAGFINVTYRFLQCECLLITGLKPAEQVE